MKPLALAGILLFGTLPAHAATDTAIFAGGCFWCTEADFEKLPGVLRAVSGYTGGTEKNPTYEQVSNQATGHTEAVEVTFDPAQVSYSQLVEYHWRHIDPTAKNRQFCDSGPQYRSGIYWKNAEQKKIAEASKIALEKSGVLKAPIATEILAATSFWPAEDYHQDYYKKNPVRYRYYRSGCGRDERLKELWSSSK